MLRYLSIIVSSFVLASCLGGGGGGSDSSSGDSSGSPTVPVAPSFGEPIQFGALSNLEGTAQELSMGRNVAVKLDPNSEKEYLIFSPDTDDALNNTTAHTARVFGFNQNNELTDFTSSKNPDGVSGVIVRGMLYADFNSDGFDDIYFSAHGTEANTPFPGELDKLMLNDGNGVLVDASNLLSTVEPGFGHMTSLGDLDEDGDVDVFVNNLVATDSYALINNGSAQWDAEYWDTNGHATFPGRTDNTLSAIFQNQSSFSGAGVGSGILDLDNDGDNDIIVFGTQEVGSPTKMTAIFENDGLGNFSVTAVDELFDTEIGIEGTRHGDIDGDGDIELIGIGVDAYASNGYGNIVIKIFDGSDAGIQDVSNMKLENDGVFKETTGAAKGFDLVDLDDDGDLDIFYKNQMGQDRNYERHALMLLNDGSGNFTEANPSILGLDFDGTIFAFADLDGDGDKDLIFQTGVATGNGFEDRIFYSLFSN